MKYSDKEKELIAALQVEHLLDNIGVFHNIDYLVYEACAKDYNGTIYKAGGETVEKALLDLDRTIKLHKKTGLGITDWAYSTTTTIGGGTFTDWALSQTKISPYVSPNIEPVTKKPMKKGRLQQALDKERKCRGAVKEWADA